MSRKRRIGQINKYEKKCQAARIYSVGRPPKLQRTKKIPKNIPPMTSNNSEDSEDLNNIELPPSWNTSHCSEHHIVYKVQEQCSSTQPLVISHSVTVCSDMTWSLSIYGLAVSSGDCEALAGSPDVVNCTTLHQLVWKIDSLNICPGHPDEQFVTMAASRGGNFHAISGELFAYLDKSGTYHLNGQVSSETVRSSKCHRLINGIKCLECSKYRDTIRATYYH